MQCLMCSITKRVRVGVQERECEGTSTHWRGMKRWREDEAACSMLDNISMATTSHPQRTAKISQDPSK